MRSLRWLATIALVALALTETVSAQTQTPPSQYFPQTGHTVQGDFMRFFNTRGGLAIFGYPLTEAFVQNGRLVQYFQRVRMEAHPEDPVPYQVQLGLLGSELGYATQAISAANVPSANDPNRRYFPQTGHTVSLAFREYFDAHGGLDIFGYPIAEFELEGKRIIQYFQRAKMEWHPELPPGQRVQLGNLGEIYATTRLDPSLLQPGASTLAPNVQQVTSIRATASLRQAVTGASGQQILYVYVVDQRDKPVQGASSHAVVRFPSGDQDVELPATDVSGHAQVTFDLGRLNPGQLIVVQVRAAWAALAADTETSFFVWW